MCSPRENGVWGDSSLYWSGGGIGSNGSYFKVGVGESSVVRNFGFFDLQMATFGGLLTQKWGKAILVLLKR